MDVMEIAVKVVLFMIPFLFSLCFHEFAHAYVAKMKGDDTAEHMGRLTLNPMPHIDWIGTIGLPVIMVVTGSPFLFGWAKPVPVNPRNLGNRKTDMFWVAFAGPLSNILLFVVGIVGTFILIKTSLISKNSFYVGSQMDPIVEMLKIFLSLNLILAFFNLIPLHPLDGGKILERFIPYEWNRWLLENQQMLNMVFFILIIAGGLSFLAIPVMYILNISLGFVLGVA